MIAVAAWAGLAHAGTLALDVTALERGAPAAIEVRGAAPGAWVGLVAGSGVGPGPCPPPLGGRCLDVRAPVVLLGGTRADAGGTARFTPTVPAGLAPDRVALQAVSTAGPSLSPAHDVPVLDPLPPYPERTVWDVKAIQPDFWPDPVEIAGNAAGGVAMNLVWAAWEPVVAAPPCGAGQEAYDGRCFTVDAAVDAAIADWTARGLVVTAVVYGTPAWARVSPCSPIQPGFEIFCAPADAADYGRFVGFLARRYDGRRGRGRIADVVVHNEVNANAWYDVGCGEGLGACDVDVWLDSYAASFVAAYDAAAREQPSTKVFVSLDHHFDARWDRPGELHPLLSGQTVLEGLDARAGGRTWRVAAHPYPPNLFAPAFSPDDLRDAGKVTYGSLGALQGWLAQRFGDVPAVWDVHLTESGVSSAAPASSEAAQADAVCASLRNVLGTPGIRSHVYHRMQDNPNEGGLLLGLRRIDGSAKPAWATWALANRHDLVPPQLACGFEDVPWTRLVRSYHPGRGHWASSRRAPPGFVAEASWRLERERRAGTSPLFACVVGDHALVTRDPGCEGLVPLGPVGHVFDTPAPDRVALHRCRVASNGDHFVSPDPACEGQVVEHLLGYALHP